MNFDLILLDIETQRDFFLPRGSCYTPAADSARPNVYALFEWARKTGRPVISTVLRVPPGRIGPMGDVPHCVEGTDGEKKLAKTILNPYANLGLRNSTDLPRNLFQTYRQAIFEKRHTDIFQHARAERLITELSQAGFVLCGAGVSKGIVQAAVGLRNRGFSVVLASDAVLDLNDPRAKMAYERMQAKGVLFLTTRRIIRPARPAVSLRAFRTPSKIQR